MIALYGAYSISSQFSTSSYTSLKCPSVEALSMPTCCILFKCFFQPKEPLLTPSQAEDIHQPPTEQNGPSQAEQSPSNPDGSKATPPLSSTSILDSALMVHKVDHGTCPSPWFLFSNSLAPARTHSQEPCVYHKFHYLQTRR